MRVRAVGACLVLATLAVYAFGTALGWYGGRLCYRSCESSDTPWFWYLVGGLVTVMLVRVVMLTLGAFRDRTVMDGVGVDVTRGTTHQRLRWDDIERIELNGVPSYPARAVVHTSDGQAVRLRGITVAAEGGQGESVDDLRRIVGQLAGRPIPVERAT